MARRSSQPDAAGICALRINTPFTNEHFAAYCLRMVGQPYWYGTCGYKATTSLLNRKSKQYPSHYASSRMSRYKQDIRDKKTVCDCIGGLKGDAWTNGGQAMRDAIGTDSAVSNKCGANGCLGKRANSMFSWAKSKGMDWGAIDTLPEIGGLACTRMATWPTIPRSKGEKQLIFSVQGWKDSRYIDSGVSRDRKRCY